MLRERSMLRIKCPKLRLRRSLRIRIFKKKEEKEITLPSSFFRVRFNPFRVLRKSRRPSFRLLYYYFRVLRILQDFLPSFPLLWSPLISSLLSYFPAFSSRKRSALRSRLCFPYSLYFPYCLPYISSEYVPYR